MLVFLRSCGWLLILALVVPVLSAPVLSAAPFPTITEAERALTEVPGYPEATAVVLFKRADLRFRNGRLEPTSQFSVHVRIKVLKDEGKQYGEISVPHSRLYRLREFEGRTVLPSGKAIPLGEDSIFKERTSKSRKSFVTKAAFPAVEPGAILDYRYTLVWDNMFFLQPWYFHDRIPTLLSELTMEKPKSMGIRPWQRETTRQKIQLETTQTHLGHRVRVWAEDLPPIPEEPYSFPFADLSSRFMVVPTAVIFGNTRVDYFDSWETVCKDFETHYSYGPARRKSSKAAKQARQLVSGVSTPGKKARAIYAFVRDQIRTSGYTIYIASESTADRVLAEGQGSSIEQAILLQAMLAAVKVNSQLVWAADRREGHPDLNFPNTWWFDHVLVRIELDGEPVFLDATDQRLAFGVVPPYYEGSQALLMDKKNPQAITLPARPFDENSRHAVLALALDEEGRVTGTGSLRLAGHHARSRLKWKDDAEATTEAWDEWLTDRFTGFEIEDVEHEESVGDMQVRVSWKLAQREEEVLGDETSIDPSRPLGPVEQILTLAAEQRLTPLMFSFADRDEVELSVTWPETWEIDLLPGAVDFQTPVGAVVSSVELDEARRKFELKRRFDLFEVELSGREKYTALQELYQQVEKSDGQELVFIRP